MYFVVMKYSFFIASVSDCIGFVCGLDRIRTIEDLLKINNMRILILLILLFIIFACNQSKDNSIRSIVHETDVICKNEILRAENDIHKNKIVY
jgi:hypothetical protein